MADLLVNTGLPEDDSAPPSPAWKPFIVDLDHPLLRFVVSLLDLIWRGIVVFWSLVIVATVFAPLIADAITGKTSWQDALSSPWSWPIVQFLATHGVLALLIVPGGALFTWLCHRAHIAKQRYDLLRALRSEFLIERVSAVTPQRLLIFDYHADVTVPRVDAHMPGCDAMDLACQTLRACVRPSSGQRIGVVLFGRSMQGKTRLAWDAMQAELAGWTLVNWSLTPGASAQFDVDLFRGRRVALWLNDLNRYANDAFASTLCGLPERFARAHIPLAIIATCRDERREEQARQYLSPLLNQLQEIWPADITEDQARTIARMLAHSPDNDGPTEEAYFHRWDEQTPGSIVLGPDYMRNTVASGLSQQALFILWTLQALYAARVRSFSLSRIKVVSNALFGWPGADEGRFRAALIQLMDCHYIRVEGAAISPDKSHADVAQISGVDGEVVIPDSYLEDGIPEFVGWQGVVASALPNTQQALIDSRDGVALLNLGEAYYSDSTRESRIQVDRYDLRLRAEACFRHARDVYAPNRDEWPIEWATAAHNLAGTLHAQTHCLPDDVPNRRAQVKTLLTEAHEIAGVVKDYCLKQFSDTGLVEWESRALHARRTEDTIWYALGDL